MKVLGVLLVSLSLFGSQEEEMIKNIASPKTTLSTQQISAIQDPFEKPSILDANKSAVVLRFDLKAILDTAALINGKWLKVGDKVNGYNILQIGKNSVLLASGKEHKILHLFKGGR